jgi:hypothetical protein
MGRRNHLILIGRQSNGGQRDTHTERTRTRGRKTEVESFHRGLSARPRLAVERCPGDVALAFLFPTGTVPYSTADAPVGCFGAAFGGVASKVLAVEQKKEKYTANAGSSDLPDWCALLRQGRYSPRILRPLLTCTYQQPQGQEAAQVRPPANPLLLSRRLSSSQLSSLQFLFLLHHSPSSTTSSPFVHCINTFASPVYR